MEFDVIVIGGGPAGSTAAIVMARAGLRVHLVEKDEFPRHKLCGEFLSGDGTEILNKLQLDDTIISAGAIPINRCLVSSTTGARFEAHLPGRPLSLTRYRLDLALLDEARRSGSEVTTGSAVTDTSVARRRASTG